MEFISIIISIVITSLATAVLGMVGYWLIYSKSLVTKEEVLNMIAHETKHGDYNKDKPMIFDKLDNISRVTENFHQQVREFVGVVNELKIELAKLSTVVKYVTHEYERSDKDK